MSGTAAIDGTHDPALASWVESANTPDCDFPIQNLPFGRFRTNANEDWRIGVAIGDQVLDLRAAGLVNHADMHRLMALPPPARRELRAALSQGLRRGSTQESAWRAALRTMDSVELGLPCPIRNYTDFYVGIHHATAVGKLFRPDNPLLPNYKWVPIGYHGRASSIIASGQPVRRPRGQVAGDPAPRLAATQRLDHELELGFLVGAGNDLGEPIAIDQAEDHLFGVTLFNDWSARDVQPWEYQPLGPFLAKNFASTVSPWIVTMEALAPFRASFAHPEGDPQPLPYLDGAINRATGALDISLEVRLQTAAMREAGQEAVRISHSNAAEAAYWTAAQLVTHHTVNGCNLQSGDLLGSGTLSGPRPGESGSMLELSAGGKQPITLPNGETRTFLEDGDTLILAGHCERAGARRIGFGLCSGTVLPTTTVSAG